MAKRIMGKVDLESHDARVLDDEAKLKSKYSDLIKQYLDRQKEFVSKKKRLRALKEKMHVLLDEARQRLTYLTEIQRDEEEELQENNTSQVEMNEQNRQ